jgi:hypothetical protein
MYLNKMNEILERKRNLIKFIETKKVSYISLNLLRNHFRENFEYSKQYSSTPLYKKLVEDFEKFGEVISLIEAIKIEDIKNLENKNEILCNLLNNVIKEINRLKITDFKFWKTNNNIENLFELDYKEFELKDFN